MSETPPAFDCDTNTGLEPPQSQNPKRAEAAEQAEMAAIMEVIKLQAEEDSGWHTVGGRKRKPAKSNGKEAVVACGASTSSSG